MFTLLHAAAYLAAARRRTRAEAGAAYRTHAAEPKFWDVEWVYRSVAAVMLAVVSASAQQAPRPGQMPSLPLTQLDESLLSADLDNRTFTLTFAQPLPVNDLLLLIVRGTSLSIVPDPGIQGSFIGELKNVTVRQALELILPPLGLGYSVDGSFVRVIRLEPHTRLYDINYIASVRTGDARIGAAARDEASSYATVATSTTTDVFADLEHGVQTLLSEHATFNIDRKAGLLQVTDFPERLDRIGVYLDAVLDRAFRQVQIDARVLEIELKDEKAQALDWTALLQAMAAPADTAPAPAPRPVSGLRITDVAKFMAALEAQGTVSLIANPRLLALNNEPAIVRASSPPVTGKTDAAGRTSVESFTLSVTPQIAPGGVVMLSLSPILTVQSPSATGEMFTSTRESDTLARVVDGETVVLSGFGHERQVVEKRVTGVTGGWFGRSTVTTRRHVELLILLTPKILTVASSQ